MKFLESGTLALKDIIKNLFIYTEPKQKHKFVLEENAFDKKMHQLHENGTKQENIKRQQEDIGMQAEQEAEQQGEQQNQQQSGSQSNIQSQEQDQNSSDTAARKDRLGRRSKMRTCCMIKVT